MKNWDFDSDDTRCPEEIDGRMDMSEADGMAARDRIGDR